MAALSDRLAKVELGVYGKNTYNGHLRQDEFLPELRGRNAIKKFQEMRDNESTVGAVCYATEQVLRDVKIKIAPSKLVDEGFAKKEADFLQSVLDDMEHSLDDHISEALSFLPYGFSLFETVYKLRSGKKAKYPDGRIGIKKLASRAQWTIQRFDVDNQTGEILGYWQDGSGAKGSPYVPMNKSVYYRTTVLNNDPAGRSILRNAYRDYTYLTRLQEYEAVAIERELHGIPVGRIPAEYLSADASDANKTLRTYFETVLRDVKNNEQSFILLPSDMYQDSDGKPTGERLMDVELITSSGSRSIDIDPVIARYQAGIARSVMAEFLLLGSSSTGSYALSKSKTDLFLRSMESYINTVVDVLNKQLVEPLWKLNGLPTETMPKLVAGDVAPYDLAAISSFLRNLNNADIGVAEQPDLVEALVNEIAELPFDKEAYIADKEEKKAQAAQEQQLAMAQAQQAPSQGALPNGK